MPYARILSIKDKVDKPAVLGCLEFGDDFKVFRFCDSSLNDGGDDVVHVAVLPFPVLGLGLLDHGGRLKKRKWNITELYTKLSQPNLNLTYPKLT